MLPSNDYAISQVLLPAVVMFFLVWGLIGAAIGDALVKAADAAMYGAKQAGSPPEKATAQPSAIG